MELKRRILELEDRPAESLQYELNILDKELNRLVESLQKKLDTASKGDSQAETKKTHPGHGPRAQPELPIEEVKHDVDEADRVCASCGGSLHEWQGHEDVTEEVHVVGRRFVMRKHVRSKWRCKCGCIEMRDLPPRLVPGGRYPRAPPRQIGHRPRSIYGTGAPSGEAGTQKSASQRRGAGSDIGGSAKCDAS